MSKRFTLLLHKKQSAVHVDFLLENEGERLWTWQIDDVTPFVVTPDNFTVFATRIFDHRKIYLDFEGELSENRGSVKQIDSGIWVSHVCNQNDLEIDLEIEIETKSVHFSGFWKFLLLEPEQGICELSFRKN